MVVWYSCKGVGLGIENLYFSLDLGFIFLGVYLVIFLYWVLLFLFYRKLIFRDVKGFDYVYLIVER